MKSLFYVIIATALVTIAPYLLTFEKGQDLSRGLLEYGIFAVLLLYVSLINKQALSKKKKYICLFAFYVVLVLVSWSDMSTILFYKEWPIGLYGLIPLFSCMLALMLLKETKRISLRQVSFILFVSFFTHFFTLRLYPSQPLFQFSIPVYLTQKRFSIDRNHIPDEIKKMYNVTDSVSITKYYVDTTRSNVVVLVESWGIPIDSTMFLRELGVFDGIMKDCGIHFRMYSRTRTAEREDLLDSAWQNLAGKRDSLFMPNRFVALGYKTAFLFGGDSTIQWRYKYIRNIGFHEVFWTDSTTNDAAMAVKIDSILTIPDSAKHFIAWTTCDTKFPMGDDPAEVEKLYFERLFGTLRIIADLARKHPDVRFVVQGDHEPILAPLEFQAKFYRRWVPYVILN